MLQVNFHSNHFLDLHGYFAWLSILEHYDLHACCVWCKRRPTTYALHDTRLPFYIIGGGLVHAAVINAFSLLTAVVFHDAARIRGSLCCPLLIHHVHIVLVGSFLSLCAGLLLQKFLQGGFLVTKRLDFGV